MFLRYGVSGKLFAGVGFCALLSAPASAVVLDFETFTAGDVITSQIAGVTISATGGSGEAMIFDSNNYTGGDRDLAAPFTGVSGEGQLLPGNLLIISEDGDSSDPDDEADGGTLSFVFDAPVTVNSLDLFDVRGGDTVTLDGVLIGTALSADTNNNQTPNLFTTLATDSSVTGTNLVVTLVGSGSVDNINVSPVPVPAAAWLFGSAIIGLFATRRKHA